MYKYKRDMPFTRDEALHYQTNDLKRWSTVLKRDVFRIVKELTAAATSDAKDPYDIPRGDWITNTVVMVSYDLSCKV